MSDINTTLINSFSKQFAPTVSAEDFSTMQQSIIEQSACCKEISGGQPLPQLVLLSGSDLTMKQLQIKTLSHSIKYDLIDNDFPAFSKEWKEIPAKHRNLLRESFKSDNQKQKRRMAQQDANDSSLSSDNMSETDGSKLPIMVNVLSSLTEMSVEPAYKRSQRS
ncbi:hypothetical protein F4703DRAFT_1796781 [Phycomyces blakesleeanus]